MNEARAFLDDFRTHRDFKRVNRILAKDHPLRDAVFAEISSGEYPYADHASWIAVHYFKRFRKELTDELFQLVLGEFLQTTNHTLQRNLCTALVFTKVDLTQEDYLLEHVFKLLESPDALPALKCQIYRLLDKHYLKKYPELLPELKQILETWREGKKASLLATIKKFEKKYSKRLNSN